MKAPETVVTQEDRELAAGYGLALCTISRREASAIRRGEWDDLERVQWFARHRIAHRPPPLQSGEMGELVEKAKVLRLIGDAHRTQDYAGRTHGFIYNAGETVPLGAVVIAAEGCEQEVGRARLDLIVAAVNALPTLLATITALQAELASARKAVEAARDYVEEAAGSPPLYSKEARATVTANANAELKRIDAWLTANGGE